MPSKTPQPNKPHFVNLLISNYYQIHGFILTMVPNRTDAEDILQNTILYMWEHFDDFQPGTHFLAWAVTLAKYQVLTHRKTRQRSKVHFTQATLDTIAQDSQKMSQALDERHEALQTCLKKLRQKERDLLTMRFTRNWSVRQIANLWGSSSNMIYRQLSHIKGLLLNCIDRTLAHSGA